MRELQEAAEQREQDRQSERETLTRKRHECNEALAENNFDYDFFVENPLINASKEMYKVLEGQEWRKCAVCSKEYLFVKTGLISHKCPQCSHDKKQKFAAENELTPLLAPPCLSDLTPVEKSAISLICPIIAIYKMGRCQEVTPSAFNRISPTHTPKLK